MKNLKVMLSACVAALAFTSCTQDELPQPQNTRMKSVEVSLENAKFVPTRGLAGDKIKAGDPVKVNNFKIFLLDHSGKEYNAKVSDGSAAAQTYWSSEDLAGGALDIQFHYVDHGCSRIVAVANIDEDMTYEEFVEKQNLDINREQDQESLTLYAQAELRRKGNEQHNNQNVDGTTYTSDVYEAQLLLKPRISRFEVDGFRVAFNSTPKYQKVVFDDILFDHYPTATSLLTDVEANNHMVHISDLNVQSTVYNWFNSTKEAAWYWDNADVTVTPAAPAVATTAPLAYHTFAGSVMPRMVIKLLVDDQPAYIYTKGFYSTTNLTDGKPSLIENLEEGKIYRMSAPGPDGTGDGFIPVDEDDIDPMDRCLEITIDVQDWVVDLVFPEF